MLSIVCVQLSHPVFPARPRFFSRRINTQDVFSWISMQKPCLLLIWISAAIIYFSTELGHEINSKKIRLESKLCGCREINNLDYFEVQHDCILAFPANN